MGDILMTRSALCCLKQRFHRPVAALVRETYAPLARLLPEIDEVFPRESLFRRLRNHRKRFQDWLGVTFANSLRSARELHRLGCRIRLGYPGDARSLWLTHRVFRHADPNRWEVAAFHDLVLPLVGEAHEPETPPPLTIKNRSVHENLAVIHAGASKKPRRWPLRRFLRVAAYLVERGFEVRILVDEPLDTAFREPGVQMIQGLGLTELIEMIAGAGVFIGNDAGPAHLAAALGVPCFILYGPGHPIKHRPIAAGPVFPISLDWSCSPCRQKFFRECRPVLPGLPACLAVLQTVEVTHALEKHLPPPGAQART